MFSFDMPGPASCALSVPLGGSVVLAGVLAPWSLPRIGVAPVLSRARPLGSATVPVRRLPGPGGEGKLVDQAQAPATAAATAAGWDRNGECAVSRSATVVGVLDKALISLMKRCCRPGRTVLSFAVVM